jgi:hypothetical protein
LAVGAGYVLGVLVLLGRTCRQWNALPPQELPSMLVCAGIGLLYLMQGTGWAGVILNFAGFPIHLAINALLLLFSFLGLRIFKNRAFLYWVWGFAIHLVREIAMNLYATAIAPVPLGAAPVNWFWHAGSYIATGPVQSVWLLEAYWLGEIVASVFMAAGLILLVHHWGPAISRPVPTSTAGLVAGGVLLLLLGIEPSFNWFGSPGGVTTVAVNAVMFGYALFAWRRGQGRCFALWALACATILLLTVGAAFNLTRHLRSAGFDVSQMLWELELLALELAGILWLAGLILALRQLTREAGLRKQNPKRSSG